MNLIGRDSLSLKWRKSNVCEGPVGLLSRPPMAIRFPLLSVPVPVNVLQRATRPP